MDDENGVHGLRRSRPASGSFWRLAPPLQLFLMALIAWPMPLAQSQAAAPQPQAQLEGTVRDSAGRPVAGAAVLLQGEELSMSVETKTNAAGVFVFPAIRSGAFSVRLKKSGFVDVIDSLRLAAGERKHCDFVLRRAEQSSLVSSSSAQPTASSQAPGIELDDTPHFTVAGVTDSTGSGGHGSETRMRTGETLAKQTLNLGLGESKGEPTAAAGSAALIREKPSSEAVLKAALRQNPQGFEANHGLGEFYFHAGQYGEAIPFLNTAYQANPGDYRNSLDLALALQAHEDFTRARELTDQILANGKRFDRRDEANLRRLRGDLDEKLNDPLAAVREYERAAGLEPSEPNYFAWGAELLLHRAAAPAIEVFSRGARLHPDSSRMLAGLGAALYTSGSAEEAAQRLCAASDLAPSDPAPYLFLGEIQEAFSTPLPCVEQKFARFADAQPENALANFYYALALWKRVRGSQNPEAFRRVEALLQKSSMIDPKLDSPYLQLGNLYFAWGTFAQAVAAYQKAVAANAAGSQAHYRLGLTYKRLGDDAQAKNEFEQYKQLDQKEAAAVEEQRRELQQFIFVLKDQNPNASVPKAQMQ